MGDESATMCPVLTLSDVSRVHGAGARATQSLRSVSLEIHAGEFVAIVGPSGAGKSTLLNIVGLLDRPTSGRFLFDGVDTATLTERERDRIRNEKIGFVFQDSHMLLDDTAAGNAALALHVRGIPIANRRHLVGRALAELGIKSKEAELTSNLSGGERQRVAIARAIAGNPTVVLADEPTGALDTANTQNIIERLRTLNAAGTTVVVITHDPVVANAAQRRLEIVDGTIHGNTTRGRIPSSASMRAMHVARPIKRATSVTDSVRRPLAFWRSVGGEFLNALSGLGSNIGRTMLLLLAFALGAGGLVCAAGISQSAAAQVTDRLTAASLDEVTVRFADPLADARGYFAPSSKPRTAIHGLPHVSGTGMVATIPRAAASLRLLPGSVPGGSFTGPVLVADSAYLRVQGAVSRPDHAAGLLDNTWSGAVALLGRSAAKQLGVSSIGPGSMVWLGMRSIDVVGVIDNPGRDARLARAVILSPAAAIGLNLDDPRIVVRTRLGYPASVADAIPRAIRPDKPAEVRVDTVADLRNLQKGVGDDLGTLVAIVSALLLLLAGFTSSVAMFMSVRTRSGQIALLRAVGASRASIARRFIFEGALVGATGGLTGASIGLWGVVMLCLTRGWTPALDPSFVLLGVIVGAASGLLSSLYPAIAASRQDPAQAIRG